MDDLKKFEKIRCFVRPEKKQIFSKGMHITQKCAHNQNE